MLGRPAILIRWRSCSQDSMKLSGFFCYCQSLMFAQPSSRWYMCTCISNSTWTRRSFFRSSTLTSFVLRSALLGSRDDFPPQAEEMQEAPHADTDHDLYLALVALWRSLSFINISDVLRFNIHLAGRGCEQANCIMGPYFKDIVSRLLRYYHSMFCSSACSALCSESTIQVSNYVSKHPDRPW